MNADLRDILFLDIETIASTDNYHSLDERIKVQWSRKSGFFKQRDETLTDEDLFHERAGIYAEFGKIIVICVGRFTELENGELGLKLRALANDDEKTLLTEFKSLLEKLDHGIRLCAHNGKEFDFPYLSRRMLVNGISLPGVLNTAGKKSWDIPHLDTMELWKFGDYKHYTSLDLLTAIFDIPSSKDSMDGSQVNEVYYKEKNLTRIADYCLKDVIAVAQVYLKMRNTAIIPENNIFRSTGNNSNINEGQRGESSAPIPFKKIT